MPAKDLGAKHTCFKCGAKFYDLKRTEPICPKCGADQRQSPATKPSTGAERRRAPPKPPPPVEPETEDVEADVDEEAEGDDDEDEADDEP